MYSRIPSITFIVPLVVLALHACHSKPKLGPPDVDTSLDMDVEEGTTCPVVAPDFALEDQNPLSPTYEETRSVNGVKGKVLLIYFANLA